MKWDTKSEAHLRHLRMAPRKVSLVVSLIRGKPVGAALNILKFTRRSAAAPVAKLIKSHSGTPALLAFDSRITLQKVYKFSAFQPCTKPFVL